MTLSVSLQKVRQIYFFAATIRQQDDSFIELFNIIIDQIKSSDSRMYRNDHQRYKKRLNISSLNAAICNVAVFKSMKERQFKDEIYISYCEQGVILQASSQQEWQKANKYVQNFITNKKISLLAYGYQKEIYEELIIKGLKDYTKRMKELGEDCPYINIIHYQKLRKSCEYMHKEHYIEPLKDWQRKNKKNPNFAFLIVEPAHKYEDVKRRLLEYLTKKQIHLTQTYVSPLYFLLLFFTSSIKQQIKDNFEKTMIQITLEKTKDKHWKDQNGQFQEFRVRLVNYSELKLNQIDYKIVSNSKNISRLGLEFISSKQIQNQAKKIKQFLSASAFSNKAQIIPIIQPFQIMQSNLIKKYGQNYSIIAFKKSQREKYHAVINKFINKTQEKNINQISQQIQKNIICGYDQIQFLSQVYGQNAHQRGYKIYRACLNDCPYMIHAYQQITINEIDTFLLYIQQLKVYSCTYLVRFYGISIKYGKGIQGQIPANMSAEEKIQGYTYYLIFDYHYRTFQQMMDNDMILDNFQIAQMLLQILYLVNFLHTHEEPRSLGQLKVDQVYWPLRIVLPYLKNNDDKLIKKEQNSKKDSSKGHYRLVGQGFEGDVRLAGLMMKTLLETGCQSGKQAQNEDDHFSDILQLMLKESKYQRITLTKCISTIQELLVLN